MNSEPSMGESPNASNMAFVTWTIVAAFFLLLFIWCDVPGRVRWYHRVCKTLHNIPGWPTHWLWGNLHQVKPDHETLMKWTSYIQDNGYKITRGWLGPFYPVVGIHHYEPLKKILKEPKQPAAYDLLVPWLGDGLLISSGAKWFRNRHLLTPAFHFQILKPHMSVYNSSLHSFLEKWSIAARNKQVVHVYDTISLLSLDIILQCAFSYRSDCQNVRSEYICRVKELTGLVVDRFFVLPYRINWIYYFTSHGRKMRKACRVVHEHSEKVMKERKKVLGIDSPDSKVTLETATRKRKHLDFLDVLLTAVDDEGNGMTDREIRDEVDTFMFEGHDTTASGMTSTLYCLAKHPEHQEKVREEVRRVLNGREWLEYDDLKELKYTQWCIKEALRLYPPVFQFFRRTSEDIELEDGCVLPKGLNVNILPFTIHRHPDVWENPNEYNPLRFHPDEVAKRDPLAYIPFSADQRNCIGQNFAMNEMRTVIATIVHRFSFTLEDDQTVELVPRVILKTKNDINFRVEQLS